MCGCCTCLLMHLVFMSVFKRSREITKYFKLTEQTSFHRINDVGEWQDVSSFTSGNGEELSLQILFPIFSLRKEKKISLKRMYLSLIGFQLYFLKPQTSKTYRPAVKYAVISSFRTLYKDILYIAHTQFTVDTPHFITFVISFLIQTLNQHL